MTKLRKALLIVGLLLVAFVGFVGWQMIEPKPQSPFADGQPAPDFTLNDQDGHPFTLSRLHGSRAVLVFYRGYW